MLAADRQSTYGNTKVETRKLRDLGQYWFVGCGNVDEIEETAEWLRLGAPKSSPPTLETNETHGIAVRKRDGLAFVVGGKRCVLIRIWAPQFAIGSGSEYAQAAMALGKNAEESVLFASQFDINTGLGVDSVAVKPKAGKRKR